MGEVPRGTALYSGGLRDGDIVTAVGQKSVGSLVEMGAHLGGLSVGETVAFSVKRGDEAVKFQVKVQSAESRTVGRMRVLENVTNKQKRIRQGMKTGTTDR